MSEAARGDQVGDQLESLEATQLSADVQIQKQLGKALQERVEEAEPLFPGSKGHTDLLRSELVVPPSPFGIYSIQKTTFALWAANSRPADGPAGGSLRGTLRYLTNFRGVTRKIPNVRSSSVFPSFGGVFSRTHFLIIARMILVFTAGEFRDQGDAK
jgi:hypothetical protein